MASEPLEQADVVQRLGPFIPSTMDAWAAAMSDIIIGARNGLTLSGPFSISILACSNRVVKPPIPLPTTIPMLSWLAELIWIPECSTAWMLAATDS